MKKTVLFLFFFLPLWTTAQSGLPEFQLERSEVEAHLRFLASDELMGRRTGSPGNNLAARYLAEHLKSYGYDFAPGLDSYFQEIPMESRSAPGKGSLVIGKESYGYKEDFVILGGGMATITGKPVFAGYGWVDEASEYDDYKDLDVRGKVVFVLTGIPDDSNPMNAFNAIQKKRQWAAGKGAAALVELYRISFPWNLFRNFFKGNSIALKDETQGTNAGGIVHIWMKERTDALVNDLKAGKVKKVAVASDGFLIETLPSKNVIGVLEGTDPVLKNEYILLTAHFDHVGAGQNAGGGGQMTALDSIYNGARDNAMGVVALLSAAKSLARERPKRSVIVLAVTGEEEGLLGSGYYAEHPLIPLNKVRFNLNTDGGGYNDVTKVAVIGFGRTGTDEIVQSATEAAGLSVFPNPAPEQNLFDRSDNVSFAKKGIPGITYSPGLVSFDDEINRYYHQVTDEADSIDFDYLLRYCRGFAHTARQLANHSNRPAWKEGDKYEKVGKELYNH